MLAFSGCCNTDVHSLACLQLLMMTIQLYFEQSRDGAYNLLKELSSETVSQSLFKLFDGLNVDFPTAEYFESNPAIVYFLYNNRQVAERALNSSQIVFQTINDLKQKLIQVFKSEPKFSLPPPSSPRRKRNKLSGHAAPKPNFDKNFLVATANMFAELYNAVHIDSLTVSDPVTAQNLINQENLTTTVNDVPENSSTNPKNVNKGYLPNNVNNGYLPGK